MERVFIGAILVKDDGKLYFIANLIAYILMCVLNTMIIINFIENILLKIIIFLVLLLACGYVEERFLSIYINKFVESIISKKCENKELKNKKRLVVKIERYEVEKKYENFMYR